MTDSRKNLIATISPSPFSTPLQLRLIAPTSTFIVGHAVTGLRLIGSGGAGAPYSYTILTGTGTPPEPAPGLTLDGVTGEITGTPTTQGTFAFVAEVEDSGSNVFPHGFTIKVVSGFEIVSGAPTDGEEALAYSFQFIVNDDTGAQITGTFTIGSGSFPAWASISSAGLITGTPSTGDAGISYFVVHVDNGTATLDIQCSLRIWPVLTFLSVEAPVNLYVGLPFADYGPTTSAVGGKQPFRYQWVNLSDFPWLNFDYGTNTFSGTPDSSDIGVLETVTGLATDAIGGVSGIVEFQFVRVPALVSIVEGANITVDDTDPFNPIVSSTGGTYTPPVTTKGDLFGFSTVPARVPVGSNLSVLVADSAQALGVRYAPIVGGMTLTVGRPNGPRLQAGQSRTFFVPAKYASASAWSIAVDPSASISIDIWYRAFGATFPTVADSIVGGTYPATTGSVDNTGTTSGWTVVDFDQGAYIKFYIRSNDVATNLLFQLVAKRSL